MLQPHQQQQQQQQQQSNRRNFPPPPGRPYWAVRHRSRPSEIVLLLWRSLLSPCFYRLCHLGLNPPSCKKWVGQADCWVNQSVAAFSATWSCVSLPRDTASSNWKFKLWVTNVHVYIMCKCCAAPQSQQQQLLTWKASSYCILDLCVWW